MQLTPEVVRRIHRETGACEVVILRAALGFPVSSLAALRAREALEAAGVVRRKTTKAKRASK